MLPFLRLLPIAALIGQLLTPFDEKLTKCFRETYQLHLLALLRLVWVAPFFPSRRIARSKPTLCPSFRL